MNITSNAMKKMRSTTAPVVPPYVFDLEDKDQRKLNYYISQNTENIIQTPGSTTWSATFGYRDKNKEDDKKEFQVYPCCGHFKYRFNGHDIAIKSQQEGDPIASFGEATYYKRVQVEYGDFEVLKEFMKHVLEYKPPLEGRLVRLYYSDVKNGMWMPKLSIYAQTIENIFIDNKIKQTLVSHIDDFVANKARYISFGRPYKMNILLHGVPGSGKSSLIKSIAMKYNRPIYILSFSKTLMDDGLISLINQMDNDAILMLEDIDSFFIKRDPADRLNVSFSCLLNVLDGALTRQGMICFMTANDMSLLDSALIRPGRVDRMIQFDYPRREHIRAAYDALADNPSDTDFAEFYSRIRDYKINMSGIVDYLFRGNGDVEDLIAQTKELTRECHTDKLFL